MSHVDHGWRHAPKAKGGTDPIPATAGWNPYVDALTGGAVGDDYLVWSDNATISDPGALGSPVITFDPADNRVVYFPAAATDWPHAVYEIEITGSDVIPAAPYSLSVHALRGSPGSWVKLSGVGGFPGSGIAFSGNCYGFWNNYASTDKDPLICRFLFHCRGGFDFNAIVAETVGTDGVSTYAFEITIVQVHPGTP